MVDAGLIVEQMEERREIWRVCHAQPGLSSRSAHWRCSARWDWGSPCCVRRRKRTPGSFSVQASYDVTSLAFDPTTPTTLYAATRYGGVYKSEDGGATWRYLRQSREVRGLGFLLAIAPTTPTTLYLYGARSVYKSADGGETWRAVNRGLELGERNWLSALSIDPTNPRVVFARTGTGVYKSENGGESWRKARGIFPRDKCAVHRPDELAA
jgi:photosystem II stability/assembly factor-like uncharacterized protein